CGLSEITQRGLSGLMQLRLLLTQHQLAAAVKTLGGKALFTEAAIQSGQLVHTRNLLFATPH
ncbi:hypothetical protein, partial [Planktotalea sp.]|uniref:hypothetical protein n=1 Tax=Planktotalea sp. TaxID=2029877 RepID=UPI0025CED98F